MKQDTPLLLLPGLMNDERVWEPIVKALRDRPDIVVCRTDGADTIEGLAEIAIGSMPPGPFGVAGFSLGGYVALEVCRRGAPRIAGLALLDTGARADSAESTANRKRLIGALGSGAASFAQIAAGFAPRLLHASRANESALIALLADMARVIGADGFVRQQTAAMNRPDARDVLRGLRCPALVVCGRDDLITPLEWSEEAATLLPGRVELVVIDDCGHMSPLERPDAVSAAFERWTVAVDAG